METTIDYLTEFEIPLSRISDQAEARREELAHKISELEHNDTETELWAELKKFDQDLTGAINRIIKIKELEKKLRNGKNN